MELLQKKFPAKKLEDITSETVEATGFSVRSVARIRSEMRRNCKVVTPGKKKPNLSKAKQISYDEFTRSGLRKHVHNFFRKNEPPTVDKHRISISQDETMPKMTAYKISQLLHEIGFKFKRRKRRSILIEKNDKVHCRLNYLQNGGL